MKDAARSAAEDEAIELTRRLFLRDDNLYGCAETALVALQQLFDLPEAEDSSAAMALNGGVAYGGGICGAISGAAMAVGRLAAARSNDHQAAKRIARLIVQDLAAGFEAEFGGRNCSELIDYQISIPAEHDAFIASGVWRDTCMKQLEFAVARLHQLSDIDTWNAAVQSLESPGGWQDHI